MVKGGKIQAATIARHRSWVVTVAALVCATAMLLITMGRPRAAGVGLFTPGSDDIVVETLPGGASERGIRVLRNAQARNPDNARLAVQTASRLIERGRTDSDPRYYGYAQGALAHWWTRDANAIEPDILLLRAIILQNRHDFEPALADLRALVARQPGNVEAWLVRASVEQVRGRYKDALNSCGQVRQLAPGLTGDACAADVRSLTGDADDAYRGLSAQVADQGIGARTSGGGWVLTLLAEMAERTGDNDGAERYYRSSLALSPDIYTKSAYADFLLDRGRAAEASALLEQGPGWKAPPAGDKDLGNSLLQMPDPLLLRLALADHATGVPRAGATERLMADRFDAARLRGETAHGREEARFALHVQRDPQRAVTLAVGNWESQREPADMRILLESARAAGRTDLFDKMRGYIRDTGLQDRRLPVDSNATGGTASSVPATGKAG